MKENVICGHLIPAGTGLREYDRLVVSSREDIDSIIHDSSEIMDVDHIEMVD